MDIYSYNLNIQTFRVIMLYPQLPSLIMKDTIQLMGIKVNVKHLDLASGRIKVG